jgi:hypothetical protein
MNQENSEEIARDAFSPENFNTVLLIQMMRTYDILLALLAVQDPKKAMELAAMHEKGLTFTPAPAFSMEQE